MGNRALVVFHDGRAYSPVTYVHWNGSEVPMLLARWRERMEGRMGDLVYGCARFIGICHDEIGGNTGLGCWDSPGAHAYEVDEGARRSRWKEEGHGDAGVFLVDCRSGAVERIGGSQGECRSPHAFTAGETAWASLPGEDEDE